MTSSLRQSGSLGDAGTIEVAPLTLPARFPGERPRLPDRVTPGAPDRQAAGGTGGGRVTAGAVLRRR